MPLKKDSFHFISELDCIRLSECDKTFYFCNSPEISNFVTFQQIRNLDSHKYLVVLPALNLSIF